MMTMHSDTSELDRVEGFEDRIEGINLDRTECLLQMCIANSVPFISRQAFRAPLIQEDRFKGTLQLFLEYCFYNNIRFFY